MNTLYWISCGMFLFFAPVSLGVLFAAHLVDDRVKLELPYKILRNTALISLFLLIGCNMFFFYNGPQP